MSYHLFVSYNHRDEDEVLRLVRDLRNSGLRLWVDTDGNLLGKTLDAELERLMKESLAVGVFIGAAGLGGYQRDEQNAALAMRRTGVLVFPIILPGAPDNAEIPAFLANRGGADFRDKVYPKVLERLVRQLFEMEQDRRPPPPAPVEVFRMATDEGEDAGNDTEVESEDALEELADALQDRPPAFFVGSRFVRAEDGLPPSACEVSHTLLRKLGIVTSDSVQEHAGVILPLDTASRYFAAAMTAQRLERSLRTTHQRSTRSPALHRALARVLRRSLAMLRERAESPVAPSCFPLQLVVTTSTDLALERELVASRLPFTRVVMGRSGQQVQVNRYASYLEGADGLTLVTDEAQTRVRFDAGSGALRRDDLDAALFAHGRRAYLRDAAAEDRERSVYPLASLTSHLEGLGRRAPLVLYKHHGSQDCRDSCTVSTDQYFELASITQQVVPAAITGVISNAPSVFLGYSPLDPDFRQMFHTLLQRHFDSGTTGLFRYLLQCAPERDTDDACRYGTEHDIWRRVKRLTRRELGIEVLEVRGEDFLQRLLDELPAAEN